jgi:hypothetical protein
MLKMVDWAIALSAHIATSAINKTIPKWVKRDFSVIVIFSLLSTAGGSERRFNR